MGWFKDFITYMTTYETKTVKPAETKDEKVLAEAIEEAKNSNRF